MAQIEFPPNPYHGQVYRPPAIAANYIYDRTRDSWYFEPINTGGGGVGGSGGANVIISDLAPAGQENGTLWIESNTYFLYVWDEQVAGDGRWVGITNNGGDNTSVYMDVVPPSGAQSGQMWFDTEVGNLSVFYNDANSAQWVTITSNGQSLGVTSNIIRILEREIESLHQEIDGVKDQISESQAQTVITLE